MIFQKSGAFAPLFVFIFPVISEYKYFIKNYGGKTNDGISAGRLFDSPKNKAALQSIESLREAQKSGEILEARVIVCTAKHDLILDLGAIRGVIPRNEGAIGIESGETRDIAIISRVNKPVCFRITGFEQDKNGRTVAICSRKTVQEECTANYLDKLIPGDVIPAVVTHMERDFFTFAH